MNRLILLLDVFVILFCGWISYTVQPWIQQIAPPVKAAIPLTQYATLLVFWLPLWMAAVVVLGLHRIFDKKFTGWQLFRGLVQLHAICLISISAITYTTQLDLNRSLIGMFFCFSFPLMYLVRVLVSSRLKHQYEQGHGRKNILLLGAVGPAMTTYLERAANQRFAPKILGRMVGVDGDRTESCLKAQYVAPTGEVSCESSSFSSHRVFTIDIVGTVHELEQFLHDTPVDEVVFFAPFNSPSENIHLLNTCEELGVPSYFSVNMDKPSQAAPRFAMQYDTPFVLFDISPKRPDLLAIKHSFDVVCALLCIVLFSPIMIFTALGILISMGRPILYFQKRAGRYGREFNMFKFRTMKAEAEKERAELWEANEMDGPVFKVTNDPRVTRLGSFLRRFSIDELPQLFNVLNGTMSMVGPRPLPVQEQQEIKGWRRRRLSVRPGITCIWQVSGRNEICFEEWMQMDLNYIDNWNLWLDIVLLFKTVKAVLMARGAK